MQQDSDYIIDQGRNFNTETYKMYAQRFLGDMVWRKVHALMELPDFSFDANYVCAKLDISETEYKEALNGLEQLGLIGRERGEWIVITQTYVAPTDVMSKAQQLECHEIFMSDLSGLLSVDRKSQWASGFVASNVGLVDELKKNVLNAFIEFNTKSANATKDGLYAIGFSATDIIDPSSKTI